jgi:hypothetical protein
LQFYIYDTYAKVLNLDLSLRYSAQLDVVAEPVVFSVNLKVLYQENRNSVCYKKCISKNYRCIYRSVFMSNKIPEFSLKSSSFVYFKLKMRPFSFRSLIKYRCYVDKRYTVRSRGRERAVHIIYRRYVVPYGPCLPSSLFSTLPVPHYDRLLLTSHFKREGHSV